MEYQIDTRNLMAQGVRVGQDHVEVASFAKAKALFHHLEGNVDGGRVSDEAIGPVDGFRYRLLRGQHDLASAKRRTRMHAFDPDRPLIRHNRVEFELDIDGRSYRLVPEDQHGLTYVVLEGEARRGSLTQRPFEAQGEGAWEADVEAPEDWSVPVAGFVAWLAREGRGDNAT